MLSLWIKEKLKNNEKTLLSDFPHLMSIDDESCTRELTAALERSTDRAVLYDVSFGQERVPVPGVNELYTRGDDRTNGSFPHDNGNFEYFNGPMSRPTPAINGVANSTQSITAHGQTN